MSRNIEMFSKPQMVYDFVNSCKEIGHSVIITSVDRNWREQYALFCQGREPLDVVNRFRKIAGMPPIGQKENSRSITWTLNSKHVINLEDENLNNDKSHAVDFAIVVNGNVDWDIKADVDFDSIPDYKECALIGEKLGFTSGMYFKNPDYPHLQIT